MKVQNTVVSSPESNAPSTAASPGVERRTRLFLAALAAAGGPPLETLSPNDAREVLVGAQHGARLPAADVHERTIEVRGQPLTLTIVRPAGARGALAM